MADALGKYYGPNETGLATVLDDRGPSFLDYVNKVGAQRGAADAEAKKQRATLAKDLKLGEQIGRFHSRIVTDEMNKLIDDYATGKVDYTAALKELNNLNMIAKASTTLEADYDNADNTYKQYDWVLPTEAKAWYAEQLVQDGKEGLLRMVRQPPNAMGWIDQQGGSKVIDQNKAVRSLIDTAFSEEMVMQSFEDGSWKRLAADGVYSRDDKAITRKLPLFTDVDEDGNIVVKKPEELPQGVVDAFIADPASARLIKDQLGVEKFDESDARPIIAKLLQPYVSGESKEVRKTLTVRENNKNGDLEGIQSSMNLLAKSFDALQRGEGYDIKVDNPLTGEKTKVREDYLVAGLKTKAGDSVNRVVMGSDGKPAIEIVTPPKDGFPGEVRLQPLTIDFVRNNFSATEYRYFEKELQKLGNTKDGNYQPLGKYDKGKELD